VESVAVDEIYADDTGAAAMTCDSGIRTFSAIGVIAYAGDEDWYCIDVDTSTAKILEIFLDTCAAGRVEHYLSLMRDGIIKKTHIKITLVYHPGLAHPA
jgi:hypothetical protein